MLTAFLTGRRDIRRLRARDLQIRRVALRAALLPGSDRLVSLQIGKRSRCGLPLVARHLNRGISGAGWISGI
jgi:hypothetical protein